MTRLTERNRLTYLLRLLVVVGCVFPFAGPRAFATASGLAPLPAPAAPLAPVNEEEENEREESGEERAADPRHDRRPEQFRSARVRLARTISRDHDKPTTPSRTLHAPEDPFRNGLGSPYRC